MDRSLGAVAKVAPRTDERDSRMNRNTARFACNTYSYTISHGAEACLFHLADLGFTDFELIIYPGHMWPPDAVTEF